LIPLSGCLDNTQKSQFNPEEAFMYDPITNELGKLSYLNRNKTRKVISHLDVLEILVGINDSSGHPGVNYSLTLNLVYLYFSKPQNSSRNLTELFDLKLVTNNSGIAHCILTYDQYAWPHDWKDCRGYFEVSCPELQNVSSKSDGFTYTYYTVDISRNTNATDGLTYLSELEEMNLIERVLALNQSNLQLWGSPFGDKYAIINASTIDYFSSYREAPRNEFTYDAWTLYLESPHLSYEQFNATWVDLMQKKPYYVPHLKEKDIIEDWLSSGPLSQVNCTPVWLFFQHLYCESFTRVLHGWGYSLYQVSLMTPDFELVWLIAYNRMWVS
jgi:hypothetical protein